jgi:hypothetical protein
MGYFISHKIETRFLHEAWSPIHSVRSFAVEGEKPENKGTPLIGGVFLQTAQVLHE